MPEPDDAGAADTVPTVQSLVRGLDVIRSFDAAHPVMTLSEVARRTGLSRAAARRFLHTLREVGYVRSDGKTFALAPTTLELGFSYLSALELPEIVQPHLQELSDHLHRSCSVSVLDGADIAYVARAATRGIMTVRITIGTRFPAYATSMGRVLLAALPPEELDGYLARTRLEPLTARTITDPDDLRRELVRVRTQGWCAVDQELEEGLRSIAAPLHASDGRVIAAINAAAHATGRAAEFAAGARTPLLAAAAAADTDLAMLPHRDSRPLRQAAAAPRRMLG